MLVVNETEERTVRTPTGEMVGLAAPSQGSVELSTWRVRINPDVDSPSHLIDREQVWMPLNGTFAFTVDGQRSEVSAGQAIVVPAGTTRRFRTVGGPAEALVAMAADGRVTVPGDDAPRPVPWAV